MQTETTTDPVKADLDRIQEHPPIYHLGKVKNKDAKRLKRGFGKLYHEALQAFQQVNVAEETQPLIISYEEKPGKRKRKNKLKFMGMKIDRRRLKRRLKKTGISSSFL